MQITYLDHQQGVDMLDQSDVVAKFEAPGSSVTFLLVWDGRDVVMIADSLTGACAVVESDDVDEDRGGSAHDQARAAFGGDDVASAPLSPRV